MRKYCFMLIGFGLGMAATAFGYILKEESKHA